MSIVLEAFPKLTEELLIKSGCGVAEHSFLFNDNGTVRALKSTPADISTARISVFKLEDESGKWHPEEYDLIVDYSTVIKFPVFLFGPLGIAAMSEGIIGVAILWTAQEAKLRGAIPIGEFSADTPNPFVLKGEITFPSKTLRGTLDLQMVLYLKNRGKLKPSESHLARNSGTILGVLDETKIVIDGNGSMFPIHTVPNPGEPLWWVTCKWDDPTMDLFTDDNFCIYINSAHKDYVSLFATEDIKNSPLLMEIICSSIQILVSKVLNDTVYGQATIQGQNLAPGSISSVVNYFVHVFNWSYDADNPEALAVSIRKTMMKMM